MLATLTRDLLWISSFALLLAYNSARLSMHFTHLQLYAKAKHLHHTKLALIFLFSRLQELLLSRYLHQWPIILSFSFVIWAWAQIMMIHSLFNFFFFFMVKTRDFLHRPRVSSVYPRVLLHADCLLRLQRIQRFLLLKHTTRLVPPLLNLSYSMYRDVLLLQAMTGLFSS